jgi:hypothetical protein
MTDSIIIPGYDWDAVDLIEYLEHTYKTYAATFNEDQTEFSIKSKTVIVRHTHTVVTPEKI